MHEKNAERVARAGTDRGGGGRVEEDAHGKGRGGCACAVDVNKEISARIERKEEASKSQGVSKRRRTEREKDGSRRRRMERWEDEEGNGGAGCMYLWCRCLKGNASVNRKEQGGGGSKATTGRGGKRK